MAICPPPTSWLLSPPFRLTEPPAPKTPEPPINWISPPVPPIPPDKNRAPPLLSLAVDPPPLIPTSAPIVSLLMPPSIAILPALPSDRPVSILTLPDAVSEDPDDSAICPLEPEACPNVVNSKPVVAIKLITPPADDVDFPVANMMEPAISPSPVTIDMEPPADPPARLLPNLTFTSPALPVTESPVCKAIDPESVLTPS
jgi:hypothetical protein